jgi:hypothetical protein
MTQTEPDGRVACPVRLRPVLPRDYLPLYRVSLSGPTAFRVRYRGATPSLEEFQRDLFSLRLNLPTVRWGGLRVPALR